MNLPKFSKVIRNENKKLIEKGKRKEPKCFQLLGRKGYYVLSDGIAILRGCRSQNSKIYSAHSRNNQDVPNCIVSIVMNQIFSVDTWQSNNIDLILDIGDQLYKDSYITFCPNNAKLGPENIMRKFYMSMFTIHITVYKPILSAPFSTDEITKTLNAYFVHEAFCILNYMDQWVSVFRKGGVFFLFDPHERNVEGDLIKAGEEGTAVVNRFNNLQHLAEKLVKNLNTDNGKTENFTIWLISVHINKKN